MLNKIRIVIFSVLILMCFAFKSEDPIDKLLKQIAKLTASFPQEKIHLHTDKPYYAVGESMWLKAYLVTAELNEPSPLSAILYVELIDSKNKIKKKITLPVDKGLASGQISLTDSLTSGTYRLRAYTNYMRNYDNRFFFEKFVTIGNINDTKSAPIKENANQEFALQFFPEGGNLIANVRCRLGVKATMANGIGANLSGRIINSKKDEIALFNTEHAGMGAFAFTPQANEKYIAEVTLANGQIKSFELPSTQTEGQTIAANIANNKVNIRILTSPNLVNAKDLYVIAQSNGVVYASFALKAEKTIIAAAIPIESFPTGLVQLTLFNQNNSPIAERLIFVNHHDALKIDIKTAEPVANTRKKTTLDFSIKDGNENPIDGNFSVAVLDMNKAPQDEDEETTILSNLLLTSDLKGYIEKPNYYFNHVTEDKERQLDNLLLTQGWTRFAWKDLTDEKLPSLAFKVEKDLEIGGTVTFNESKKPVPNAKIILMSTSKNFRLLLDTIADANGKFVFDKLDVPDSATFIIQAKTPKENDNVKIKLNPSPEITSLANLGFSFDMQGYLAETKKRFTDLKKYNMLDGVILLDEVSVKANKSAIPVSKVKNSQNLAGQADYVLTKEKLKYQTDVFQALFSVPGIMMVDGAFVRTSARTVSVTSVKPKPMMVKLDGAFITQGQLKDIGLSPNSVEGIEVLTSNYNTAIYGQDGYWGIILITTKRLDSDDEISAVNKLKLVNQGFTLVKEFYVPNYDDPKINQQMEDLRSTIYWNPNLSSDVRGKASLKYFNAGTPGTYKVIVEGMDNFGNIGRQTYTYEIQK